MDIFQNLALISPKFSSRFNGKVYKLKECPQTRDYLPYPVKGISVQVELQPRSLEPPLFPLPTLKLDGLHRWRSCSVNDPHSTFSPFLPSVWASSSPTWTTHTVSLSPVFLNSGPEPFLLAPNVGMWTAQLLQSVFLSGRALSASPCPSCRLHALVTVNHLVPQTRCRFSYAHLGLPRVKSYLRNVETLTVGAQLPGDRSMSLNSPQAAWCPEHSQPGIFPCLPPVITTTVTSSSVHCPTFWFADHCSHKLSVNRARQVSLKASCHSSRGKSQSIFSSVKWASGGGVGDWSAPLSHITLLLLHD